MIKVEHYLIDDKDFTFTYSDANRYVVRDGISYFEAWDPAEFGRTYTEGDIISDDAVEYLNTEATEILGILMGGVS